MQHGLSSIDLSHFRHIDNTQIAAVPGHEGPRRLIETECTGCPSRE